MLPVVWCLAMPRMMFSCKYRQIFVERNFCGLELICKKCANYAPRKFGAIRYTPTVFNDGKRRQVISKMPGREERAKKREKNAEESLEAAGILLELLGCLASPSGHALRCCCLRLKRKWQRWDGVWRKSLVMTTRPSFIWDYPTTKF